MCSHILEYVVLLECVLFLRATEIQYSTPSSPIPDIPEKKSDMQQSATGSQDLAGLRTSAALATASKIVIGPEEHTPSSNGQGPPQWTTAADEINQSSNTKVCSMGDAVMNPSHTLCNSCVQSVSFVTLATHELDQVKSNASSWLKNGADRNRNKRHHRSREHSGNGHQTLAQHKDNILMSPEPRPNPG